MTSGTTSPLRTTITRADRSGAGPPASRYASASVLLAGYLYNILAVEAAIIKEMPWECHVLAVFTHTLLCLTQLNFGNKESLELQK